MRIRSIKNKWNATVGFGIFIHPYPNFQWDMDLHIWKWNWTIWIERNNND